MPIHLLRKLDTSFQVYSIVFILYFDKERTSIRLRLITCSKNFISFLGEVMLDVAQNAAQEPTLYYSGPIFIGGPLKAYWAKGESLGPDTSVRQSPRDHQYL